MRLSFALITAAFAAVFIFPVAMAEPGNPGGSQSVGSAGLQQNLPQRRLLNQIGKNLYERVGFTYYFSYLGPSPGLGGGETYNIFRDGKAPQQMLHAFNLRYNLNPKWAVGATLAAVNDTTKRVQTGSYLFYGATAADNRMLPIYNLNEKEWFNARVYVSFPTWNFTGGFLTNNFAVELPTSNAAKDEGTRYGLVLTNTLGIYLPNPKWSTGLTSQMIRYVHEKNVLPPPCTGCFSTNLQTFLITAGPFLNYSLSNNWQIASQISFDWDKEGDDGLMVFNNNLPDRGRLALNYLTQKSLIAQVGLYTQFLLSPMAADTTVIGLDFTVRF